MSDLLLILLVAIAHLVRALVRVAMGVGLTRRVQRFTEAEAVTAMARIGEGVRAVARGDAKGRGGRAGAACLFAWRFSGFTPEMRPQQASAERFILAF